MIKAIVEAWIKFQPAEARRFYKRAADWRRWLQGQGPATTVRKTQWCPVYSFPARVHRAITQQLTPDGAAEPLDWMRDPTIRRVVLEELGAGKLTKNPGDIR